MQAASTGAACGWGQPRGLGRLGLGLGLGRLGLGWADLYECVVVTVARAAHVHDHSVQLVIQPHLCEVVRCSKAAYNL